MCTRASSPIHVCGETINAMTIAATHWRSIRTAKSRSISARDLCSLAVKIASAHEIGLAMDCGATFRGGRASVSAAGSFGTKRAPKDRAAFHIGFSPHGDVDHRRFTKIVAFMATRRRDSAVEVELAAAI